MNSASFFQRIDSLLDQAGIPYMLAGSFASSAHGTPRSTQGVDIVFAPSRDTLTALLDALPEPDYYVERREQFDVIDKEAGWKMDFIIRNDRPFSHEEFERRTSVELFGEQISIATAEDTVIAKLTWAKSAQSDRQIEDAAGILKTAGPRLDLSYVERWVRQLGLDTEWRRARDRSP